MRSAIQSANAISVRDIKLETGKHLNDVVSASEALTLDSICITGGVLNRDDYAFLSHCSENGKLSGIDLSKATTENDEIPDWAFRPSKINGAPHRATSKEDFFGNLHYIRLPHNTYRMGEQAFLSTCLRKIEIPKTVRVIGESAKERAVEHALKNITRKGCTCQLYYYLCKAVQTTYYTTSHEDDAKNEIFGSFP